VNYWPRTSRVSPGGAALILAFCFVLVGVDAYAAAAPGQGNGRRDRGQSAPGLLESLADATIDSITAQTIRGYFQSHPMQFQGLPPGIARNLARGKPLPPGIAKRYLPSDLRTQLTAYTGYEMLIADRNILLVSVASGLITDILLDVL
jgi:hypothetical protein